MSKKAIALWLSILLAPSLLATSVLPMNLMDLVQRSSMVFEGKCVAINHGMALSGKGTREIAVVQYTFEITDHLRGVEGQKIVISHLGKHPNRRINFPDPDQMGVPKYQIGGSYLLFIPGESTTTGLSVPTGLAQGVFEIKGREVFARAGNLQMMKGMENAIKTSEYAAFLNPPAKKNGQTSGLQLDQFKALVRDLMDGRLKAEPRSEVTR